jgi:hypothetical protein
MREIRVSTWRSDGEFACIDTRCAYVRYVIQNVSTYVTRYRKCLHILSDSVSVPVK